MHHAAKITVAFANHEMHEKLLCAGYLLCIQEMTWMPQDKCLVYPCYEVGIQVVNQLASSLLIPVMEQVEIPSAYTRISRCRVSRSLCSQGHLQRPSRQRDLKPLRGGEGLSVRDSG